MVSGALQQTLDALSYEERAEVADYLLQSLDSDDFQLTAEQEQLVSRRVAEITADPSIGITLTELKARFEAKWA
jgi:putative addiction module component (TIGR02574 family)